MEFVEILYGVEAAGEAGVMERVQVDPVEIHPTDARQVLVPALDRASEKREELVDPCRWRPAASPALRTGRCCLEPAGPEPGSGGRPVWWIIPRYIPTVELGRTA